MGYYAGNSLVCRWRHHHHDPEELTGIMAQAEGQAEITVMNMMVTEEAEGTDPISKDRENKKVEKRKGEVYWNLFVVCFFGEL